jgi:hypothetical protein
MQRATLNSMTTMLLLLLLLLRTWLYGAAAPGLNRTSAANASYTLRALGSLSTSKAACSAPNASLLPPLSGCRRRARVRYACKDTGPGVSWRDMHAMPCMAEHLHGCRSAVQYTTNRVSSAQSKVLRSSSMRKKAHLLDLLFIGCAGHIQHSVVLEAIFVILRGWQKSLVQQ